MPLEHLSVEQVCSLVRNYPSAQYVACFRAKEVSGKALSAVKNEKEMEELLYDEQRKTDRNELGAKFLFKFVKEWKVSGLTDEQIRLQLDSPGSHTSEECKVSARPS